MAKFNPTFSTSFFFSFSFSSMVIATSIDDHTHELRVFEKHAYKEGQTLPLEILKMLHSQA
jgi:hypothetical protein